jgi:GTPase SAR1 family protein
VNAIQKVAMVIEEDNLTAFTDKVDGRDLEIQIWDTAGQDQYRSLSPVSFRSAAAALLVDITNCRALKTWTIGYCPSEMRTWRTSAGSRRARARVG